MRGQTNMVMKNMYSVHVVLFVKVTQNEKQEPN